MTTSLTLFERRVRETLLDVVYAQWHDLGVPFADAPPADTSEVIDPEALLWCSLEFIATEPRLKEALVTWLCVNEEYIIRQRLKRFAIPGEPRNSIWHALGGSRGTPPPTPAELPHGLESIDALSDFYQRLPDYVSKQGTSRQWIGKGARRPSTILLQARDLLGGDLRHALLVYLLAHPSGAKLKSVEGWSGYSYRSISNTATRWEAAGVLSIEHGYCRLIQREPWHVLLQHQAESIVIVDWAKLFEAFIRLLRALAKAKRKGLRADSPVIRSYCREVEGALASALTDSEHDTPTLTLLHVTVRSLSDELLRTVVGGDESVGSASPSST